ncbi:MAG: AAA family ATPase [Alphaproteobacteria bacterium]|nr:AAA family ATPase [Alphaproteobacteria bacterium]
MSNTVECRECGFRAHSLYGHIGEAHDMTPDEYQAKHEGAKLLSELGKKVFEANMKKSGPHVSYKPKGYDSMSVFGVGFGKDGDDAKPIPGYEGFTRDDGVPAADPYYVFPSDVSRDVLLGIATGAKIYAKGPTGSGKTSLFEQIAARLGRPFWRQQFHQEMEPVELLGTWTVGENNEMVYLYSGLAEALRVPSIICLDEFDSGNPGVTAIANALLEGKPLVLTNKGGEKIYPHDGCVIVATGNTNGMGDETGLYTSTAQQSYATMNRFNMTVVVDYMKAETELEILKRMFGERKLPEQFMRDIVKVANMIRDGFIGNKITVPISTRQVIAWANWLLMSGNARRSFNLAFANQLGQVDRGVVEEIYQRVFGKD